MAALLTPAGFTAPSLAAITADLGAKLTSSVDPGIDLSPDQPFGQVVAIFANKVAEAYELAATVYNALNPNSAEGQLLVNLSAISGTSPQVATFSTVTCNLTLAANTTVNAGSVAAVLNQPANTWVLTAPVTSTTAGVYQGVFRSTLPGPFAANANTIMVINTPVIGWTGVTNPFPAASGVAADNDVTLRQKRAAELAGQGSGDTDAIRAAILKIPGVLQCFVFENTGLTTDVTGLPGKSFRVVVWDGAGMSASNAAIAAAIWAEKPAGILPFGAISVQTPDSSGNLQTVAFDRPTQVPLYVTCTTTPAVPGAGALAVGQALATYIAGLGLGTSIIALPFRLSAIVPGVTTDVPVFQFGTAPSPTNTANIPLSNLQIATLATGTGAILVNGVSV
jgi:uncharacterized phage protein gp47/JayE